MMLVIVVQDLERNAAAVTPYRFLIQMRELYPQFAQQNNTGMYMQQDAEECWSQLLYVFREQLKVGQEKAMAPEKYVFGCSVFMVCPLHERVFLYRPISIR
jgi:hypothetical protein